MSSLAATGEPATASSATWPSTEAMARRAAATRASRRRARDPLDTSPVKVICGECSQVVIADGPSAQRLVQRSEDPVFQLLLVGLRNPANDHDLDGEVEV